MILLIIILITAIVFAPIVYGLWSSKESPAVCLDESADEISKREALPPVMSRARAQAIAYAQEQEAIDAAIRRNSQLHNPPGVMYRVAGERADLEHTRR